MIGKGNLEAVNLHRESPHRRGAADGDLLAKRHAGAAWAGGRQADGIGTRLGKGSCRVLKAGGIAVAKGPAPAGCPTQALVAEAHAEAIGLNIKIGYRRSAIDRYVTAYDSSIAANTRGHQADGVGARLGVRDRRVLLTGSAAVAKNPAPLGGSTGAHILKIDGEAIGLNAEIAGGHRTVDGNLLTKRNTGPTDAEAGQTNRVGARLRKGDRWILLGGSTPITERPAPGRHTARTLVTELQRQAVALPAETRRWRSAADGDILAELLTNTTGTGSNQADRIRTRLGIAKAGILDTGRTAVPKRPGPTGGAAGTLIAQVDAKPANLQGKARCGRRAAQRNRLTERLAGAANAAGRQADGIGARLRISNGRIGHA